MLSWIVDHPLAIPTLVIISATIFLATLILVPVILLKLPSDYFEHPRRQPARLKHPKLGFAVATLKNILGLILVICGFVMLLTPGQGVLTIIAGVMLSNFPGKYRLEQYLIRKRSVFRTINWIRRKGGKPPLTIESREHP